MRTKKSIKYILVIASDNYQDAIYPKLNNAKLDAERFIKVITEKYGFCLIKEPLFNEKATRKNIIESLNELTTLLGQEDQIIIYFAGHGTINHKTKKGFWIPNDSSNSIGDYIPNSTVIDSIEGIDAKHILLVSDSCFSGTFLNQTRTKSSDHYSKLSSQKSRWIFASGREEVVSDGQPGVGSPFAVALCTYLENNIKELTSFSELVAVVSKFTGEISKQQPIHAHIEGVGHKGGQMIFEQINHQIQKPAFEFDSNLHKIVISYKSAQEIQKLGFSQKSVFGYFKINNKIVIKSIDDYNGFICSAFLFDEIIKFIPENIQIDKNTYIARFDGYDKVTKRDLEIPFAEVTYQRTGSGENDYMSICRFNGRMVAFSINSEGKYNNLICWANNQAESAALMLIELFKEKKISFSSWS